MKHIMQWVMAATLLLCGTASALAVPAHKGARRLQQPDGGYVSICLHGDEYLHYQTTDDGYTVVKDDRGSYVYATIGADGQLKATQQTAHEAALRQQAEADFVKTLSRHLKPQMTDEAAARRQAERARQAETRQQKKAQQYDYTKFRGLILLVEYSDKKFKYDNYQELMDSMVNQDNYQGNELTNQTLPGAGYNGRCTGSVRDYYRDCSAGLFVPQFDVVGPIQVSRNQYYPNGTANAAQLTMDAINAADELVDFSQYDRDDDGVVDMVYFIFAGLGSNYSGNDSRMLWPHAGYLANPNGSGWNWRIYKDNVAMGRYACSTELYGFSDWNTLNGIGTICHEFGHVLGLPDFYDSDYERSGGESLHPGEWSVMAGGGYMNFARTPGVYTLFERYALGWAMPQTISDEGNYELESLDLCNTGFRLDTDVKKEYFLIENRQQTKWNQYLPGHGLLVFRVDSTNASVWSNNTVNANPNHNYFELRRAGGNNGSYESAGDPFPGAWGVTELNNVTEPANLKTWSGKNSKVGLTNIREKQGVVSFELIDVTVLKDISMPAELTIGLNSPVGISVIRTPDYAPYSFTWTSSDPTVCAVDQQGVATGLKPGTATISVSDSGPAGLSAQCVVSVEDWQAVDGIAAFRETAQGVETPLLLTDAQVLYVNKNDIYVRDATSNIVFANTGLPLKKDDLVSGVVFGSYEVKNEMPRLLPGDRTGADLLTISHGDKAVEPHEMPLALLDNGDYADLVYIRKAKLVKETNGMFAVSGDRHVNVYNVLGIRFNTPKSFDGKRFDLTGLYMTRDIKGELYDVISPISDIVEVTPDEYYVIYKLSEGGHLLSDGQQLTGAGRIDLLNDDDLTLEVVADEGYELKEVLFDGEPTQDTRFELKAISDNHRLTAEFGKTSGIVQLEATAVAAKVYTLDGRPALPPYAKGLYIVDNGRTVRVVRK